jgi:hypothetical protein
MLLLKWRASLPNFGSVLASDLLQVLLGALVSVSRDLSLISMLCQDLPSASPDSLCPWLTLFFTKELACMDCINQLQCPLACPPFSMGYEGGGERSRSISFLLSLSASL